MVNVTGLGCICAACISSTAAFDSLRQGSRQVSYGLSHLFPAGRNSPCFQVNIADKDLLPAELAAGCDIGVLNRTMLLAIRAVHEALTAGGYSPQSLAGHRVGVALGTTVGCTFHNEPYYLQWRQGKPCDPAVMENYLNTNLAEFIQHFFGWHGPRLVVTNSCASATDAIGLASIWLEQGLCDIAIAGGADELYRVACHGFDSLMLVSSALCRPFSSGRDGLNLGEGAGVMLLEKEAAEKRIYGRILGYGSAADSYHPTAPHPEGRGLRQAMFAALQRAGVGAGDIAYINAHGTGTPVNDRTESAVFAEAGFGADVAVVSTKGMTGHTLGAAGGIEAVFTLLTLNAQETTGTVGCDLPDSSLPFTVLEEGERMPLSGAIGISQSLAFGGSNSVLVLAGRQW